MAYVSKIMRRSRKPPTEWIHYGSESYSDSMSRSPIKRAFVRHKNRAVARKIDFYFTFERWIKWWEDQLGPNWFERRASQKLFRTKGKFVMARYGDKGPYVEWNVKCITTEDNSSEKSVNGTAPYGENHGNATLTNEQVLAIFNSKERLFEIAKKYKTSIQVVYQIKKGINWSRVTGAERLLKPRKPPPRRRLTLKTF